MNLEKKLSGITIVEGQGLGKAYFVGRAVQEESVVAISRQDVGDHIMLFNDIREKAKLDYRQFAANFDAENDKTDSFDLSILNMYEHILDDPAFIGQVVETISTKLYDLKTAIRLVSNDFIKKFNASGNSYFKERSSDMVEICEKLIGIIDESDGRTKKFTQPVVLVVLRTLTPSDILNYDIDMVKAVISISGGKTSHAAILARSYSIPVVSNIRGLADVIRPGDEVFVDADTAEVIVRPETTIKDRYFEIEKQNTALNQSLKNKWQRPVYTKDGIHIEVLANISLPVDTSLAVSNGADGVGLVRTEYLLSNRKSFPDEKTQVEFYQSIFQLMGDKECIIRMMDIGGDKVPDFFKMPSEFNPFLGWRAIRILLEERDIFESQLRSIMQAGEGFNYKIMFPMITTMSEWISAKEIVSDISEALGMPIPNLGILFEVPLAILEMETFLKDIKFASIGTNDLLQFLSAADRNNPKVNYLYNPIEPAFLKIIKNAIDISKDNGIPMSICGEMAGNPAYTLLLVGMGLRRFSVVPKNIPILKEIISRVNFAEISESVAHLFAIDTPLRVDRWIKNTNIKVLGNLLDSIHTF